MRLEKLFKSTSVRDELDAVLHRVTALQKTELIF